MNHLKAEKNTFDRCHAQLESDHNSEDWVVVHGTEIVGVFPTLDEAAGTAVGRFGRGPYLIRQIEEHPLMLPSGVMLYDQARPVEVSD